MFTVFTLSLAVRVTLVFFYLVLAATSDVPRVLVLDHPRESGGSRGSGGSVGSCAGGRLKESAAVESELELPREAL